MPILKDPRHELFAQNLAKGKTASEAYVLAGFRKNDSNASRLNRNERVQHRVRELLQASARRTEASVAAVLQELVNVAFLDIRLAFDENDQILPFREWPESLASAVASIDKGAKGNVKIRFVPKLGAINMLARNLGMFDKSGTGQNRALPAPGQGAFATETSKRAQRVLANVRAAAA